MDACIAPHGNAGSILPAKSVSKVGTGTLFPPSANLVQAHLATSRASPRYLSMSYHLDLGLSHYIAIIIHYLVLTFLKLFSLAFTPIYAFPSYEYHAPNKGQSISLSSLCDWSFLINAI